MLDYSNKQCCNVLVMVKVWSIFVIVMPHKTGLVRENEVVRVVPYDWVLEVLSVRLAGLICPTSSNHHYVNCNYFLLMFDAL